MSNDVIYKQEDKTCQKIGNSNGVIIPVDMLNELGIKEGEGVVLTLYIRYKRDENGSIKCLKDGQPMIERKWVAFWKKGT